MSSKPNIGYQQTDPATKDTYNAATFFLLKKKKISNLEILIFLPLLKKLNSKACEKQ